MADLPRALKRPILERQRRCSTICHNWNWRCAEDINFEDADLYLNDGFGSRPEDTAAAEHRSFTPTYRRIWAPLAQPPSARSRPRLRLRSHLRSSRVHG